MSDDDVNAMTDEEWMASAMDYLAKWREIHAARRAAEDG